MKITEIADNIKKVKTKVDYSIEIQADIVYCDTTKYIYLKTPSKNIQLYFKNFTGYKSNNSGYSIVCTYNLTVDEPGTYSFDKGNCVRGSSQSVTLSPDQPHGILSGHFNGTGDMELM